MNNMKNIHLLPTEKPSRLGRFIDTGKLSLRTDDDIPRGENINIYITSDEEIKEGDWVKLFVKHIDKEWVHKVTKEDLLLYTDFNNEGSKIILTTDQDLIADGVQAIDDEFLEWFVKNPSCESVEVEKTFVTNSGLGYQEYAILDSDFKVLEVVANIPQSSYKIGEVTKLDGYEYITEYKIIIPQEEPKQETLEEGAKWQAERSYSEAIEFAEWIRIKDFQTTSKNNWIGLDMKYYTTQELFEQFKKK
jgi:hypothetical protein